MRYCGINGIDYTKYLKDGFTLTRTKTEELDSGTIILSQIKKTEFKPFNKVVIEEEKSTYWLVIDSVNEQRISTRPMLYSYTLPLISETKVLERIILPNLKITKSLRTGKTKTIKEYFNFIYNKYIAPIYRLTFDSALMAQYGNIECPEITWVKPNAKQLFNDLLMACDNPALIVVRNGELTYTRLTEKRLPINSFKGKLIDEDYLASKDYANNLVVDLTNAIPEKVNGASFPFLMARSTDSAYLTNEDMNVSIPNAVFEMVEKVYVSVKVQDEEAGTLLIQMLDISDSVVEKSIYDTFYLNGGVEERGVKYKNNYIYWEKGGHELKGLTFDEKNFIGVSTGVAIKRIVSNALDRDFPSQIVLSDIFEYKYLVVYKTAGDLRSKIYRSDEFDHDFSLVDNQNQQYINLVRLAQTEREKVNRLGNQVKLISWTFRDKSKIPEVGDYIGDFILAKKTVAYYKEFAIFSGVFSKNFVERNVYYGINSRLRFTQFEQENNIIVRNDLLVKKLVFSHVDDWDEMSDSDKKLINYINYGFVRATDETTTDEEALSPKQVVAQCQLGISDVETIDVFLQPSIFSADFYTTISVRPYDNVNVGIKVDRTFKIFDMKYNQVYVPYVNDDGEMYGWRLNYYYRYDKSLEYGNFNVNDFDNSDKFVNYPSFSNEIVDEDSLCMSEFIEVYKDNGEIPQQDIQIQFSSDDENIVIGRAIGRYNSFADVGNRFTYYLKTGLKLKVYESYDETYKKGDIYVKGNISERGIYNNAVNNVIEYIGDSSVKSWAIATEDGELIIGVNRDENDILRKTIYLSVK